VRGVLSVALLLAFASALLYLYWGPDTVLVALPWFNPFVMTFQALTCLTTSVLALGRYRVLRDPTSYWVGLGFIVYAIAMTFYVISWPGLLPSGASMLADLPGTAAWYPALSAIGLSACLFAAATSRWPSQAALAGSRFYVSLAGWVAGTVLVCALPIAFEHHLPLLVRADGTFTPLLDGMNSALGVLFIIGTAVSIRGSRRDAEPLLALVAFFQVSAAFVYLWILIASARYGLWWYLGRGVLTFGALAVLLGLLHEYVTLLKREREKTHALQEADIRKNEFIAMLSHELRNPLSTISTSLQVLKTCGADESTRARAHDAALRQSAHMARLLDDLLDVSRITRGRISLQRERIDLIRVAQDAIDANHPQLEARGHTLTTSMPASLVVTGDAVRLTQAISNLLHNAIKYTPDHGQIELSVETANGDAVVAVRDNGVGLANDMLQRVFELFVQADHSLDRQHGGLGLGLTVTRALIDLHGGTVDARSSGPGSGSEFVLRLPLEP
jgi:signal transduction histidine kinase